MDPMIFLFAAAIGIVFLLANIAIWSPRQYWIRCLALSLAMLTIPLCYLAFAGLLSKPKPQRLAWFERSVGSAQLLGASFSEGKAIYLWLRLSGMSEPRYYALPWNRKAAETLQDEIEEAARQNGQLMVVKPFTNDMYAQDGGLNIRIVPPPTLPMKPPRFPDRILNPRSTDI
ncbi:MAG: hypothetical protein ACR2PG_25470 [Hyphomicrobiaceae bacterium]